MIATRTATAGAAGRGHDSSAAAGAPQMGRLGYGGGVTSVNVKKKSAGRPNVVLFISDQQRADTMPGARPAALEGVVETPHLDWLAGQGTSFRRAYCTTPICVPARASLLSGLYPHRTGMPTNYEVRDHKQSLRLPDDVTLLAEYLTPTGYASAYVGKWHIGTGSRRPGFDAFTVRSGVHDVEDPADNDFVRFCARAGIEIDPSYSRQTDPADFEPRTRTGSTALPLAFHLSMLDATRAARFIYDMEDDARPFFLTYSCFEPHRPLACPRPFARRYPAAAMPLPATRRDTAGPELLRRRPDNQLQPTESFSDEDLQEMWAAYYGSVSYVDHLVGTILAALLDTDQFDNTLFIFTSDHGEMLGGHGLVWKGSMLYEELVNVPLLIRAPGGHTARETRRLVSHVDVVPTILGWCGVPAPEGLHGVDLHDLVEGGDDAVRDGLALEYYAHTTKHAPVPLRGWRTEEWKYVMGLEGGEELYCLRDDPAEAHNLIGDSAAEEDRQRLQGELEAWMTRTGDTWPPAVLSGR